jgi:hypothetical protein
MPCSTCGHGQGDLERFSGWRTRHAPASGNTPARRESCSATYTVDRAPGRLDGPRDPCLYTGPSVMARPYRSFSRARSPYLAWWALGAWAPRAAVRLVVGRRGALVLVSGPGVSLFRPVHAVGHRPDARPYSASTPGPCLVLLCPAGRVLSIRARVPQRLAGGARHTTSDPGTSAT